MKWWYRIYFCMTAGLLFLFGAVIVLAPEREFSDNENRVLASLPVFRLQDFWRGDYQENLEQAADDQMVFRDQFTALAADMMQKIGYRDIGGVYLGKGQTYVTKTTADDIEMFRYMENLRYVEYLSGEYPEKVNLMLVPSAGTVLQDYLPRYAPFYDAESMYHAAEVVCETTQVFDLRKALQSQNEVLQGGGADCGVYFRTDHHWTLPGAYQGYSAYTSAHQREPLEYQDFHPGKITDAFYGTLYSKVLDQTTEPDVMYAASDIGQTTSVVCDGNKRESVYDAEKLDTKDKYAYFFGGNYGNVTIQTGAGQEGTLVIFKDSFANSMVPFLLQDYKEIIMIDLRYYRQSVVKLLEELDDPEILILYEMSNFAQDANLIKLSR